MIIRTLIAWLISDSAASYWCFFVTFYAAFILIYSFMVPDEPKIKLENKMA